MLSYSCSVCDLATSSGLKAELESTYSRNIKPGVNHISDQRGQVLSLTCWVKNKPLVRSVLRTGGQILISCISVAAVSWVWHTGKTELKYCSSKLKLLKRIWGVCLKSVICKKYYFHILSLNY